MSKLDVTWLLGVSPCWWLVPAQEQTTRVPVLWTICHLRLTVRMFQCTEENKLKSIKKHNNSRIVDVLPFELISWGLCGVKIM